MTFVTSGMPHRLPAQHHRSKASILQRSAFFIVQLSHPYMTTGKTITLTRRTFVGKVTSLPLNMLSRLVITFLPRSKCVLISWLQSPSAVIFEPQKIKFDCWEPVRHSTHDKGHEEGGSAYAKAGSSLRSPPGYSQASTPKKTRVCLLYCFVLSPLTLLGAVPHHHLALSVKELTYSSN